MGIVGTVINTFVALAVGSFLTWVTIDRSRQLRRELEAKIAEQATATARLEARMDVGFAAMRSEFRSDLSAMQDRMDAGFNAVRSDLTAVALAVGAGARGTTPGTGQD